MSGLRIHLPTGAISFLVSASAATRIFAAPVINEIHYHPGDDTAPGTSPVEFVEIYNPDATALDLSGWQLADAVKFTFPAGTSLGSNNYLVISRNPALLQANTGVTALGPWSGKLSNTGETLELLDSAGTVQDVVSYKPGFPWPTAADGAGPSMELIHPALDNDLGGSWRSSGSSSTSPTTYVPASSPGWKYRKGTSEPTDPVTAWRTTGYNDSTWLTGQTPIGYGGTVSCNTLLSDMRGNGGSNYSTVYGRKSFSLTAGSIPDTLTLRVRADDGGIVWINGKEIYRFNMASGERPFDGVATGTVGIAAWTSVLLTNASQYLVTGTNVISIQASNVSKNNSSDFSFDAELIQTVTGSKPTPGASNSVAAAITAVPPQIRQVAHTPNQPSAGQAVTITTRITDPDGIGSAQLLYQIVDPGQYIRLTDAAYQTNWTTIAMTDDGTGGDAVAADGTYTAVLPASLQTNRRLIRYRVRCSDSRGNSQTVPYADDEQPNFGYFVYNGVPAWTGAFRPTAFDSRPATSAQTYPPEVLNALPPYQLIANATDVSNSQYNSSSDEISFRGTMVYDGKVYDHIQFKNRGIGSTYVAGKNKWNISFNRSRDLEARDNWGNKYAATWNNLILNANASPWAPVNRGAAGVEEATASRVLELSGNLAFRTHYVHFRVIDDADEASASSQFDGDLWGLYLALEPTEGNLLDERGLDDGNLYSIEGGSGDKKHQADGQPADSSDWDNFHNALRSTGQTEGWYRQNMDLDKLYTFLAINRLIGNVDVRPGDNYRYFHRSSDNRWEIIGYDFDMGFIPAHHWGGTLDGVVVAGQPDSILAIMRHPALAREYRNRCREIMDLMASDASPSGGQIAQLINEYAAMVSPASTTLTWANLDAALWNLNPRTTSSHKGKFFLSTMTDSRGGIGGTVSTGSWLRTLADPDGAGVSDFSARTKWFADFSTNTYPATAATWVRKATNTAGSGTDSDVNRQKGYGYKYLEWESLYGGYADSKNEPTAAANRDFPATPVVTFTGAPSFPTDGLQFKSSTFSDPQGTGTFAAWQWRIAEVAAPKMNGNVPLAPGKYEIQAVSASAELTTSPGNFAIPSGVVTAGKTYRVRTRQKDTTGNWSHWSEPIQFTASAPPVDLVDYWNFNKADELTAPSRATAGASLAITGTIQSDSGEDFMGENARNGDEAGTHLRINNPIGATVDLTIPTTGYEGIRVRYETRRSGKGAGLQKISYSLGNGVFVDFTTVTVVDGVPVVNLLDFREIAGASNNPAFSIRITFQQATGGDAGNNRFDNLTVEGELLPAVYQTWKTANFPNPQDQANPTISGANASPTGDGVSNLMRYALDAGPYQSVIDRMPNVAGGDTGLEFRFIMDSTKSDLTWKVETSTDLNDWSQTLFDSETDPLPRLDDGWRTVAIPAGNPRFIRLRVERTDP